MRPFLSAQAMERGRASLLGHLGDLLGAFWGELLWLL